MAITAQIPPLSGLATMPTIETIGLNEALRIARSGKSGLRSAKNYSGPEFEQISFGSKTAISLIGREASGAPVDFHPAPPLHALDQR